MSHHCHDEHDDHDHGDHVPPPDTNQAQSLYHVIDHDQIRTLNEEQVDSGKTIFKAWDQRLDTTKKLESDVDEQLLIFIPFTGIVKLHSIMIRSANNDQAPRTIKVFKNREDIEFDMAESLKETAKFVHPQDVGGSEEEDIEPQPNYEDEGIVEYAVSRAQFSNLQNITLFIEDNHGSETSKLFYVGLRGEWTKASRAPVVTTYEAAPNPADHKNIVPDRHRMSGNP